MDALLKSILLRLIHFVNTFSLWVVLGAAVSYLFFCKLYVVEANFQIMGCLSITVWCVYTADHIIDGIRLGTKAISRRHKVHYKYSKILIPLTLTGLIFSVILLFGFINRAMLAFGFSLALLTAFHFAINLWVPNTITRRLYLKEAMIALVVMAGFTILPLVQEDLWPDIKIFTSISYLLMNFINLRIFSYYDFERDNKSGFISGAILSGKRKFRKYTMLLLFLGYGSLILSYYMGETDGMASMLMLLMVAVLHWVQERESFFRVEDRYRFFGDMIYSIPVLYVLLY